MFFSAAIFVVPIPLAFFMHIHLKGKRIINLQESESAQKKSQSDDASCVELQSDKQKF